MRQWIKLVEDQEDDEMFLMNAQTRMAKGDRGEAYWITPDGSNYWIPTYGHHEDVAFGAFGEGNERFQSKSPEEMQAQYGHLFPNREHISYNDVAMMHGWIRVIIVPSKQRLYIELIKEKAASAGQRLLVALIRAIEPYVQEYVIEYNTGTNDATNNMVVSDARKAIALL
jgi:hypothetical protein